MKKTNTVKRISSALLVALILVAAILTLASCKSVPAEGLWENATYRRDRSFGSGATSIDVIVEVGEYSVTLNVKTDEKTLDKALLEHELIDGEYGQYGFTVYKVNGIEADWERDNAYWAIYIGEEYAMTGASGIELEDGAVYKLAWERI